MKAGIALTVLLVTCTVFSCTDNHEELQDQLQGRWELAEAFRNGRRTESIDQLYFEFAANDSLETNLTGYPENGTYEITSDGTIQQAGTSLAPEYFIEMITDTSLTLRTVLRNIDFRFDLRKAAD